MFLCGVLIQLLVCLFLLSITLQMGYMLYFFVQVYALKKQDAYLIKDKKPVSVIICAKNEADNLQQYLPAILAQRYRNDAGKQMYEVIVVNDASADDTDKVLQEMGKHYDNLWTVVISPETPRTHPGKKFALSKALEHASYDLLLLTDADCEPASEYWLEKMVAPLHHNKEIVAGYGKYKPAPGPLNGFIRWETLHTFLQYSTYAMAGKPYMAVGRNLACTKAALRQAQQSDIWDKLPSGDDDLLMQTVANAANTVIVADPLAFTISEAKNDWAGWIKQKQRHMSTGKYYKPVHKALLGIYGAAHAYMWLVFVPIVLWGDAEMAWTAMLFRCFIYWIVWGYTADILEEKKQKLRFPLYDIGWLIYNFALSPYIIWKNKRQWK